MSILFADSFDSYITADFLKKWNSVVIGDSNTWVISAGNGRNSTASFRSTYVSSSGPNAAAMGSVTVTASQTGGVAHSLRLSALPSSTQTDAFLRFHDTAVLHVDFRITSSGTIQATRNGTVLATSSNSLSANTTYHIEAKVKIDDTVGTVELRVNGSSTGWINITGQDTRNAGNATFNTINIGHSLSTTFAAAIITDIDDVVIWNTSGSVNNDFLGDVKVQALLPSGAGNSAQFTPSTGSNYACVDDASPNDDTDYVSSSTVGNVDTYAYGDLSTVGTVLAAIVMLYMKKTDAGARSVAPVVRHSGTDYVGTDINPGTTYSYGKQIYELNPGTSAAWTASEINAAEFGSKVTV